MIKMIDLIVCGREDGVFKEELVLLIGLINVWINGNDQTLNIVLREMDVLRELYGFVWGEVRSSANFEEPPCECNALWGLLQTHILI